MGKIFKDSELDISIFSPVYMAEGFVKTLVDEITKVCNLLAVNYEIILVEDGSRDNSWGKIKNICSKNSFVKGVKLSRNFGQHIAIKAGLRNTKGNWIVVMDCDLQDNPYEIKNLYNKAKEGYHIVRAIRINRKDNIFKKYSSKLFYKTFEYFTGINQDSSIANFGIYHKHTIEAIMKFKDKEPFFPAQINWVGFRKYDLNVFHCERIAQKSNYNLKKLFKLALNNILLFSDKPLKLTVKFGFFISLVSFTLGIAYLISAILNILTVSGFASIIITLFFSTGMIIFSLGIVGLYIAKIFETSKDRPLFIVEEQLN